MVGALAQNVTTVGLGAKLVMLRTTNGAILLAILYAPYRKADYRELL